MVRYALEVCPNKEYMRIHLSVKPPEIPWIPGDITEEGKALKTAIGNILGVEEVTCHGYRLSVKRGGAFSFDELLPEVLAVLMFELQAGEFEEVSAYR